MTLPDRGSDRQPRRFGLYAPFAILLVGVTIWSIVWFWSRGEIIRQLDAEKAALARAGYELSWGSRSVGGYPFRLDLDLQDVSLRAPSGWRLATGAVSAETAVLAPGHWVMQFPGDVTIAGRDGAAVTVRSKILRASFSDANARPPRISVEGIGMTVSGPAAANPLFFTSADEFHLHSKAGPDDQGAAYIEVDGGRAPLTEPLARIADGKPVTLILDTIFSHAGALSGRDWHAAGEAWRIAGGRFNVRALRIAAGDAILEARPGALGMSADGRLAGSLSMALHAAPRSSAAIELSPQQSAGNITIDFRDGQTRLGAADIGPSPRVF